ncbi:MAG TPA: TonB-dependent receptor [Chitinophagales bacterium]|nr:TonB-dependent receptor [Chitinophagales bacterium]
MKYILKVLFSAIFILNVSNHLDAATIKGSVTDATYKDPLIGASVVAKNGIGTTTDIDGNYKLELSAGEYVISFNYIGYHKVEKNVVISENETKTINVALQEAIESTSEIVVTGSIFEKRASEEVVSIEVIRPEFINAINPVRFDDVARRVTGLNVIDGQANIRSGSGWSYGVGSRVMVIVDGQPFLSPDKFDVKWDFIPIENIAQVEVLKGASSVLYGSSAMNGTINIQTIKPTSTPQNKLVTYTSFIGNPKRKETKWWRSPRMTNGVYFSRAHKVSDKFEYVVGASMYNAQRQYKGIDEKLARVNFSLRWNKNETLLWGVKGNFINSKENDIFWWENSKRGALRPGADNEVDNVRVLIDPFLIKYGKRGIKHDFKNRIYILKQEYSKKPIYMINNDYQLSKKYDRDWSLVGGFNAMTLIVNDAGSFGELLSANFIAGYAQVEKKWNKVSAVVGNRLEMFRIQNKVGLAAAPIYNKNKERVFASPGNWRVGANYNPIKNSFVRFNWGQAFRFPSLAERYATADIADVNIYPNPNLSPEYGWTSEIGFEQKFATKSKRFTGSFDVAFFWQEYNDLVEFLFDIYIPDSIAQSGNPYDPFNYMGFRTVNISKARIAGYEVTWKSSVNVNQHVFRANAGYSYSYPVELNNEESGNVKGVGEYLKKLFQSNFKTAEKLDGTPQMENVLKYRNRHLLTADFEWSFKGITLGADVRYYSFMEKMDDIFNLYITELDEYRVSQNFKGDVVIGARAFYQINSKHNIGLIIKNLSNHEYYQRPPKLESPINYTLQYRLEF